MTDKIILAGNPNVGKSTLFNALTGLRQHTGNWSGKTVGSAYGYLDTGERKLIIVDTPGTYSLKPDSPDEEAARLAICTEECDHIVVVCDACSLQRSLYLALQIIERRSRLIICVNLMDEAKSKGISIDFHTLSSVLGVPVIPMSASKGEGVEELIKLISIPGNSEIIHPETESNTLELKARAREISNAVVRRNQGKTYIYFLDRLLCNKILAFPLMLLFLFGILWLSISGANYPSELLSRFFALLGALLRQGAEFIAIPKTLTDLLIDGIYGTTAWVVSVMLPPMAIFFPLFTLLEDFGLLPRIAFNMDGLFRKCGSCGKQALTMCMGLGCNAVGVSGCRIIASPQEKLISILTNSFIPCNGRFPSIILLSSILFAGKGSLLAPAAVLLTIALGVFLTFVTSKLLSLTLRKAKTSSFALELPPYRRPKILDTLLRSLLDRTAHVLLRAIKAAAPAGLIIWLLANIEIADKSLLIYIKGLLDAPAGLFGLDGAILLAFILGLPANEIVVPIIMMCYLSGSSLSALPPASELGAMLVQQGWTATTIVCTLVFTLLHWPCATTLMTIKKECGKIRYAMLAAALPTLWGVVLCYIINLIK